MARERILAGAGEDTIHANQITATTKKEKFENWWFYNKKLLLFVVCAVLVVISLVTTVLGRERPDYTVAIVNAYAIDQDALDIFADYLEQYGKDLNNDGEVLVKVQDYAFMPADTTDPAFVQDFFEAANVKYAADMQNKTSMIWLYDDYGFSAVRGAEGVFTEGSRWQDIPALDRLTFEEYEGHVLTPENMQQAFGQFTVAMRIKEGSNLEKDRKALEYYDESAALLERLKTDTKWVEG